MFERIVVGIDLDYRGVEPTSGTWRAVEQARWLAGGGEARVDLVHSTAQDRYAEVEGADYVVRYHGVPEGGRERMEELRASLEASSIEARLVLRDEKPWLALTHQAKEAGADLVILGKHEESETGPRLGSVSARVVRKCPTPVWVVQPGGEVRPRKVLVATDLEPIGRRALELGSALARRAEAELHVVHAFQVPFEEHWRGNHDLGGLKKHYVAKVEQEVADAGHAGGATVHVVSAAPAAGIVRCQGEVEADLVVLGSASRGGIPGFLLGNTAEKVLPRIAGSILVVKPEGFVSPVTAD